MPEFQPGREGLADVSAPPLASQPDPRLEPGPAAPQSSGPPGLACPRNRFGRPFWSPGGATETGPPEASTVGGIGSGARQDAGRQHPRFSREPFGCPGDRSVHAALYRTGRRSSGRTLGAGGQGKPFSYLVSARPGGQQQGSGRRDAQERRSRRPPKDGARPRTWRPSTWRPSTWRPRTWRRPSLWPPGNYRFSACNRHIATANIATANISNEAASRSPSETNENAAANPHDDDILPSKPRASFRMRLPSRPVRAPKEPTNPRDAAPSPIAAKPSLRERASGVSQLLSGPLRAYSRGRGSS